MPTIVTPKSRFSIQPRNISVSRNMQFMGSFSEMEGACEAEVAAAWLVFYAQQKGGWHPFSWEELRAFILQHRNRPSGFFNMTELIAKGFIIASGNQYYYTDAFIRRCSR